MYPGDLSTYSIATQLHHQRGQGAVVARNEYGEVGGLIFMYVPCVIDICELLSPDGILCMPHGEMGSTGDEAIDHIE